MKKLNLRIYFNFNLFLFFFAALTGYLAAMSQPEMFRSVLEELRDSFSFFDNKNIFEQFLLIFANNAGKALIMIILGVFFGLVPLYFIYTNGLILGIVFFFAKEEAGIVPTLAGLLPHGIIELPAIFLAASYGLWLGVKFAKFLFRKEPLKEPFKYALGNFFRKVAPLLLLAAFIEAFVTPLFIYLFS